MADGNIFTLTVLDPGAETKAIEVMWIERACQLAAQECRRAHGTKTSGDCIADGGKVIGSWSYTPTAKK